MQKADRIDSIDNAKAIAILLVLIGHTDGISETLRHFIFAFHMPVFFFLSGFLLKDKRLGLPPLEFLRGQVTSLVVPYFFFAVLSQAYEIPRVLIKKQELNLAGDVYGILWGNADGLANTVLWFFTCLFSSSVIYYFLAKWLSSALLLTLTLPATVVATHFYHPSMHRMPWNLDLAVAAISFYALGKYAADKSAAQIISRTSMLPKFLLLAGSIVGLFYLTRIAGRVDMAFMAFGNPVLFLFDGALGIYLLLSASSLLPANQIASFLSRNTIVIFPLHPVFFSLFTGIAILGFKAHSNFDHNLLWSLLFATGAIILSYPASRFLFAYFPTFLGGRRANS